MNALTIDVEDYFHVEAFANVIVPNDWCRYPMRVESNTYRLLELLDRRAVRATFFMLGWVAERCPSLVRHILDGGHEIGSHGYGHQMIGRGDEKTFRRDVGRAKSILEDQTGTKIKGYRAPSYSITSKTLWALEVLVELGFEYDSSIFPVHHDYYGIPDAPRFPHIKRLRDGGCIFEFPPSTLAAYGRQLPVAGGGYFRLFPYGLTAWAIRRINKKKSSRRWSISILGKSILISLGSPRLGDHDFVTIRICERQRTKFARLLEEFSWGPMSEVLSRSWSATKSKCEVSDGL